MAQLLKLPQLFHGHRVPEMDVRRRGVDPQFHPQWPALLQLRKQVLLGNDGGTTAGEGGELVGGREHGVRVKNELAPIEVGTPASCHSPIPPSANRKVADYFSRGPLLRTRRTSSSFNGLVALAGYKLAVSLAVRLSWVAPSVRVEYPRGWPV